MLCVVRNRESRSREAAGRRNLARSGAQKNERQKKELAATSAELSSGAADHQPAFSRLRDAKLTQPSQHHTRT
jgi:hypothetical protein